MIQNTWGPFEPDIDETVHVPLIMKNTPKPERDGMFQLVDVMPSILLEFDIDPLPTQGINIFKESRDSVYVNDELYKNGILYEEDGKIKLRNRNIMYYSGNISKKELKERWKSNKESNIIFRSKN